jgi:hypothetical protein
MGLPSSLLGYRILPGLQPTKNYLIATVNLQYFLKAFIYMLKLILEQLPTRQKKKKPHLGMKQVIVTGLFRYSSRSQDGSTGHIRVFLL